MTRQRPVNLNPFGHTALKISYPPVESPRQEWIIQPMRFIPHDGRASQ